MQKSAPWKYIDRPFRYRKPLRHRRGPVFLSVRCPYRAVSVSERLPCDTYTKTPIAR
jgi:hypothetical protein